MPTWAIIGITLDSLDMASGFKPFQAQIDSRISSTPSTKMWPSARNAIAGASDET